MAMDFTGMPLEKLSYFRRQLAKRANQRMVELEKAGYTSGNAMSQWAKPYLNRQGRNRFSERKTPLPVQNLYKDTKAGRRLKTDAEIRAEQIRLEKAELAQLQRFLDSPSSTVYRVEQLRKKAREAFKQNNGVDLTDEELDDLFELDAFEWFKQIRGSQELVELAKAINEGQATTEEVRKKIDEARGKAESDWEDKTVESVFEELGLEWKPEYRQVLNIAKMMTKGTI